ncbi:HNH endonuclease [Dulcicalothrix desertica PCC 7102]|uniref:HNH endonuclease n=1 Tax=Dulcicalothrix desertica PCC 7102 TaxID=232991 RepID=A0A433V8X9_9CYAN|nr:HNH endonuclease signature motif containing protein [Dulcicalothrix desertica]RUT02572.1 HNH endonuclease [Dulcicalothrix desertica PCC 7102]TWH55213.1 Restriction endonuclease [Dulcicalothrix desertica PCC 7102]
MSAYIAVELQKEVRAKFCDCCAYCRTAEFLIATTFEFEHIRPRSAGGETNFNNICLACPSCNRYKASRQTGLDIEQGQEAALFHPQQQLWEEHFAWNEDCTEIIGITEIGRATISVLKMNRPQLIRIRKMWVEMGEHPPNI